EFPVHIHMVSRNRSQLGRRPVGMLRQLGIAALLVGAAVGCAPDRSSTAGEPPEWVDAVCPGQDLFGSSEKRGGVPADFAATAVVRCRTEVRTKPGDGTWVVRITERADLPVPKLVEMLRRPSDRAPAN